MAHRTKIKNILLSSEMKFPYTKKTLFTLISLGKHRACSNLTMRGSLEMTDPQKIEKRLAPLEILLTFIHLNF